MVRKEDLEILAQAGFETADPGTLPDLLETAFSGATPAERLESLLAQGINPYCVRVGNTSVRLVFHNEEGPLEEKLKAYFLSLKCRGSV